MPTSPKQPLKSVIHSYADSECSPNPSKVDRVSASPPLYFVLRRTPNDHSTDKESSKRGQNYRPTCQAGPEPPDKDSGRSLKFLTFHKTDGGKLYPFQTHSILNTIKNKQSESHPTGSFDWKHRKGISPAVPLEPRLAYCIEPLKGIMNSKQATQPIEQNRECSLRNSLAPPGIPLSVITAR